MNILILRVSAIGDVVHTLPAIFLLKKLYPNAKISWVVQEKAACLIKKQPFLENVWLLPNKFLKPQNLSKTIKTVKKINKIKWDAIIDFQGIFKTSALLPFIQGPKYSFCKNHARSRFSTYFTKHHITPIYTNIIEKNLSLVDNLVLREYGKTKKEMNPKYKNSSPSISELKKDFHLTFPKSSKDGIDKWLEKNKISKFIAIAPNTTWQSKHWPKEHWKKLLNLLEPYNKKDYKIVLFGAHFGQPGISLAKYCKQNNIEAYPPPKVDLITTAYLISKASLLIGPDTGLVHLADFLDTETIAIFGPTKVKKHGPLLKDKNIDNAIQISCPHHQQKTHGDGSQKQNCMYQLTPEDLQTKINNILKD